MEKSQDKCACVGDNHTCGKVEPSTEVENLGSVFASVQITRSCVENVPVEQEHAPTEFMESGAYANYPYVCTPIKPDVEKDTLLLPTITMTLGSGGTSPDSEQLSVPNTSLEGSSGSSPDAAFTSSDVASYSRTLDASQASGDDLNPIPKDKCVSPLMSTSPQRPTDINIGQRTTFHQFSPSEQGGILKCRQYVMPVNEAPPQRRARDPTENRSDNAGGSSSSGSRSQSIGSNATSGDTLTGSSGLSEDVAAVASFQKMRSTGPKVKIAFNVEGSDASDTLDNLTVNPEGVDSCDGKNAESKNIEGATAGQANNQSEDVPQVGPVYMEEKPGTDVSESVDDSQDNPTKTRSEH